MSIQTAEYYFLLYNPLFLMLLILIMGAIVLFLQNRVAGYLFATLSFYSITGIVFAMEVLTFNDSKSNSEWFSKRYTLKMFKFEFFIFFPIIFIFYTLIKREFKIFFYKKIFLDMKEILDESEKTFFRHK